MNQSRLFSINVSNNNNNNNKVYITVGVVIVLLNSSTIDRLQYLVAIARYSAAE